MSATSQTDPHFQRYADKHQESQPTRTSSVASFNRYGNWSVSRQRVIDLIGARPSKSSATIIAAVLLLLTMTFITVPEGDHVSRTGTQSVLELSGNHGQQTGFTISTKPTLFKSIENSLLLGGQQERTTSGHRGHRMIFVGDIHGCIDELMALLAKVEYDSTKDHIITTGDMVNKGPNSAAVLEFLRSQKASCVRGNHDDKILGILGELRGQSATSTDTILDIPESAVALSLSSDQVAYLQSCPAILHVGKFKGSDLVVVHAGLVPSFPLHEQTASHVMNMRIIDVNTLEPSPKHEAPGSVHWFELWNRYQRMSIAERCLFSQRYQQVESSTTVVVYGHDAKKGLQLHKYTRGLDTMCVKGGKLSALVIDEDENEQLFQVDCNEY